MQLDCFFPLQVLVEQLTTSPWNNMMFMMYYGLVVEGIPQSQHPYTMLHIFFHLKVQCIFPSKLFFPTVQVSFLCQTRWYYYHFFFAPDGQLIYPIFFPHPENGYDTTSFFFFFFCKGGASVSSNVILSVMSTAYQKAPPQEQIAKMASCRSMGTRQATGGMTGYLPCIFSVAGVLFCYGRGYFCYFASKRD